jgi:hypothetical protein
VRVSAVLQVPARGVVVVMVVVPVSRAAVKGHRRSALEGVKQARPGGERGGDVATFQDVERRAIAV